MEAQGRGRRLGQGRISEAASMDLGGGEGRGIQDDTEDFGLSNWVGEEAGEERKRAQPGASPECHQAWGRCLCSGSHGPSAHCDPRLMTTYDATLASTKLAATSVLLAAVSPVANQ